MTSTFVISPTISKSTARILTGSIIVGHAVVDGARRRHGRVIEGRADGRTSERRAGCVRGPAAFAKAPAPKGTKSPSTTAAREAPRRTRTERDLPKRISEEASRASERVRGPGTKSPDRILEAPPGIEPGMEVLQTSALPLGDGAPLTTTRVHCGPRAPCRPLSLHQRPLTPAGRAALRSATAPLKGPARREKPTEPDRSKARRVPTAMSGH